MYDYCLRSARWLLAIRVGDSSLNRDIVSRILDFLVVGKAVDDVCDTVLSEICKQMNTTSNIRTLEFSNPAEPDLHVLAPSIKCIAFPKSVIIDAKKELEESVGIVPLWMTEMDGVKTATIHACIKYVESTISYIIRADPRHYVRELLMHPLCVVAQTNYFVPFVGASMTFFDICQENKCHGVNMDFFVDKIRARFAQIGDIERAFDSDSSHDQVVRRDMKAIESLDHRRTYAYFMSHAFWSSFPSGLVSTILALRPRKGAKLCERFRDDGPHNSRPKTE